MFTNNKSTLWKFLDYLKLEQSATEKKIQIISKENSTVKKVKYLNDECDRRIIKLVNCYDGNDKNVIEFLKGIAHNISF